MKSILLVLLLTSAAACAQDKSELARERLAAARNDMIDLRDQMIAGYKGDADPMPITFPSGCVRLISKEIIYSTRDPSPEFPLRCPVGYVALLTYRINKLNEKIAKQEP